MQIITNQELEVRDQITNWLHYYGVTEWVEIEKEVEGIILKELSMPTVTKVYVDSEGWLNIEHE